MATEGGKRDPSVADQLHSKPFAFDFFQAVRLLRRLHAREGGVRDENGQFVDGGAGADADEVVRFRTHLSLDTPASSIYGLERPSPGKPPQMTVTFLGLVGSMGALPAHYTEMLIERRFRHRDRTAHDFLDIFNHRLISLFFKAWEKHHVVNDYESGARDRMLRNLLSLVGMGTGGLQGRLSEERTGVPDRTLAYYAGLLGQRPRSAAALRAILSDYFKVPVEVVQFVGHWVQVPDRDATQLGVAHHGLGGGAMLGARLWDCQSHFRLRLGPLTRAQFQDFVPSGEGFKALVQLTRFHVGQALDFDVQPVLRKDQVPFCVLGGTADNQARLGWSTWLRAGPFAHDADDPVYLVGRRRRWRASPTATCSA
jgi:type VI secretion system protein ImpH